MTDLEQPTTPPIRPHFLALFRLRYTILNYTIVLQIETNVCLRLATCQALVSGIRDIVVGDHSHPRATLFESKQVGLLRHFGWCLTAPHLETKTHDAQAKGRKQTKRSCMGSAAGRTRGPCPPPAKPHPLSHLLGVAVSARVVGRVEKQDLGLGRYHFLHLEPPAHATRGNRSVG